MGCSSARHRVPSRCRDILCCERFLDGSSRCHALDSLPSIGRRCNLYSIYVYAGGRTSLGASVIRISSCGTEKAWIIGLRCVAEQYGLVDGQIPWTTASVSDDSKRPFLDLSVSSSPWIKSNFATDHGHAYQHTDHRRAIKFLEQWRLFHARAQAQQAPAAGPSALRWPRASRDATGTA